MFILARKEGRDKGRAIVPGVGPGAGQGAGQPLLVKDSSYKAYARLLPCGPHGDVRGMFGCAEGWDFGLINGHIFSLHGDDGADGVL